MTPDPCNPAVDCAYGNSHPMALKSYYKAPSRFAEKSSRNISHVCFLELVILPIISVDIDIVESLHHSVNVKTHVDKTVNEIFVISLVPTNASAHIQYSQGGVLTLPFVVLALLL
jgi:hypothetical protein